MPFLFNRSPCPPTKRALHPSFISSFPLSIIHLLKILTPSSSKKTRRLLLFDVGFNMMLSSSQFISSMSIRISSPLLIPVFARSVTIALSLTSSMELMSIAISSTEMSFLVFPLPSSFLYVLRYLFLMDKTGFRFIISS